MDKYKYYSDEEIKQILRKKKKRKSWLRFIACLLIIALISVEGFYLGRYIGNKRYEKEIETLNVIHTEVPIVNVAYKQIGNPGGKPFWSWYGFNYRVSWCACFVSWCENECGYIKKNLAPKFAVTSDGANWFKKRGQWLGKKETPDPGDIIYFDWEQDHFNDHVGIVAGVDDEYVYTIEGNSSDLCRVKSYEIGSKVILGYGQIKWQ